MNSQTIALAICVFVSIVSNIIVLGIALKIEVHLCTIEAECTEMLKILSEKRE